MLNLVSTQIVPTPIRGAFFSLVGLTARLSLLGSTFTASYFPQFMVISFVLSIVQVFCSLTVKDIREYDADERFKMRD